MKTLLFSLFGLLLFSFTSGEITEPTILAESAKTNEIVTLPCASCPEACCAIIINLPGGGIRTIKACCDDIIIIQM